MKNKISRYLLVLGCIMALTVVGMQFSQAFADDKRAKPVPAEVYGKIQLVTSFPDVKVKVVKSFGDLKVEVVSAFADEPGEWEMVDSFPDFKVEIVEQFEDFTIEYVKAFPGVRKQSGD